MPSSFWHNWYLRNEPFAARITLNVNSIPSEHRNRLLQKVNVVFSNDPLINDSNPSSVMLLSIRQWPKLALHYRRCSAMSLPRSRKKLQQYGREYFIDVQKNWNHRTDLEDIPASAVQSAEIIKYSECYSICPNAALSIPTCGATNLIIDNVSGLCWFWVQS